MRNWRAGVPATAALVLSMMLAGCGGDSSTNASQEPDRTAPPAPLKLRVDKIRDGEVWLSWGAVRDDRPGEVRYVVHRQAGADSAIVSVDTTSQTWFKDWGLEYTTVYTYYITAMDAAGNQSAPSAVVTGQPFNNLAPLAPTGVRVRAYNLAFYADQKVELLLDWDANVETDLREYRVYRDTSADFATDEKTLRASTVEPRFTDDQVRVGVVYYYRITAVDRGGKESPVSTQVWDEALPQAVLLEPVHGQEAPATPLFRWFRVAGARSYRVVVTTFPASGEISAMPVTADTTASFVGAPAGTESEQRFALESGQVYFWKVIASTQADGRENSVSEVESFKVR